MNFGTNSNSDKNASPYFPSELDKDLSFSFNNINCDSSGRQLN